MNSALTLYRPTRNIKRALTVSAILMSLGIGLGIYGEVPRAKPKPLTQVWAGEPNSGNPGTMLNNWFYMDYRLGTCMPFDSTYVVDYLGIDSVDEWEKDIERDTGSKITNTIINRAGGEQWIVASYQDHGAPKRSDFFNSPGGCYDAERLMDKAGYFN
jgi:hypothetical protein